MTVNRAAMLVGLTRLRQAACDPRLLGLSYALEASQSAKLQALRELVSELIDGSHRALVFSQFTSMLKLISDALDEDGVKHLYLDGATADRQALVDRFQNDASIPVFLVSLKAGGSGLNLTAADTVIHFDPWWNPAVEDQASDRAHRIGQKRVVTVYRLVAAGTIEEKMLELKQRKRELAEGILSGSTEAWNKLTDDDIDWLLT